MNAAAILALIEVLAGGITTLLEKTKATAGAGATIADANQVVLAILQVNAQIQGVAIDWTDPAAVANYVQTLPTFTPIPDPAAPAAPASDAPPSAT